MLFYHMGPFAVTPWDILNVTWMEPQNSIPDPLILVYFTGVKQDFNAYIAIRETTKMEEVLLDKQQYTVLYPRNFNHSKILMFPMQPRFCLLY